MKKNIVNPQDVLTIYAHPDVPSDVVEGVVERLDALYQACGGSGFTVEIQEEEIK